MNNHCDKCGAINHNLDGVDDSERHLVYCWRCDESEEDADESN